MSDHQTITLAGGCFWCLEAVFRQLKGVQRAVSGYIGGWIDEFIHPPKEKKDD